MSAIEVAIPKEIRSYESKIIGAFSVRKLACAGIAVAGSVAVYQLQAQALNLAKPSGIPCFIAALPGAMFMFRPYGLPMELFLKAAFIDNFIAPKDRIYQIENSLIDYYGFKDDDEVSLELVALEGELEERLKEELTKKELKQINKEFAEEKKKILAKIKQSEKPEKKKDIPIELQPYI